MTAPPIVITGCPRSGTKMMGRVIGNLIQELCLVTEHDSVIGGIPEDQSQVFDHELWWEAFDYPARDSQTGVPLIESPLASDEAIESLRERYLEIARGRQLVIKNPSHVLYPSLVRQIFPDAQFLYCLRDPWPTIHSMTKAGRESFLLRSHRVVTQGQSLVHKAAMGWSDAVASLAEHRDDSWCVIRYEEMTRTPVEAITQICEQIRIDGEPNVESAVRIPRPESGGDFYRLKQQLRACGHVEAVLAEVEAGSRQHNYDTDPFALPGGWFDHMSGRIKKRLGYSALTKFPAAKSA
ncbi:MAG: sulfotransferase [Planctomycetota bacterium]